MTYITKAATRGVDIDELEVTIEATVDLRGVFELDRVRAGLAGAQVTIRVRSDADEAVLDELRQVVTRASAVYDSLVNPVPIQLAVQRMPQCRWLYSEAERLTHRVVAQRLIHRVVARWLAVGIHG